MSARWTFVLLAVCGAALATASRGQWDLGSMPAPAGSNSTYIEAVSCTAAADCWAVGLGFGGSGSASVIERWDGAHWQPVATAMPDSNTDLGAVACSSSAQCFAAGSGSAGYLIERWDGSTWTISASASHGGGADRLYGVACASDTDCWAVGSYVNGNVLDAFAVHWNGSAWSEVPVPNPSQQDRGINELDGVTCTGASDCWAAGFTGTTTGPFIVHWDGAAWTQVSAPVQGSESVLSSIACADLQDCWAVGAFASSNGFRVFTLIERWDGHSWQVVASPNASASDGSELDGVSCPGPSLCWAVGESSDSGVSQTLVQRWDGSTWSLFPSPNSANAGGVSQTNGLEAIACASALECWAIGHVDNGANGNNPLALHFTTPDRPPTAFAGDNFSITEHDVGELVGSGSDPDAGDTLRYRWQQVVAAGDPVVSVRNADTSHASFDAPFVSRDRRLTFRLTVTDDGGASAQDDVVVTVLDTDPAVDESTPRPGDAVRRNNHVGGGLDAVTLLLLLALARWRRRAG